MISSSLNRLMNVCDEIDASVFSGELLFIDEERLYLKEYLERWQRAITDHERNNYETE